MDKNQKKWQVAAWVTVCVFVLYMPTSWLPVQVIIGEAADQKFSAMVGVGEVIRARQDFEAFTALKKDFVGFSRKQSFLTGMKAETAWFLSRFTNLTKGATHFENVRRFGPPPWAHEMTKTSKLGDLVFFKKKPLKA